jgi:hypothetical protein
MRLSLIFMLMQGETDIDMGSNVEWLLTTGCCRPTAVCQNDIRDLCTLNACMQDAQVRAVLVCGIISALSGSGEALGIARIFSRP